MTNGHLPTRRWLHLAPALAQFAVSLASYILPQSLRLPIVGFAVPIEYPLATAGTFIGLCAYCVASLVLLRSYRKFLAQQRSDDDLYAARWLSRALATVILFLGIRGAYQVVNLVRPLGYGDLFGPFIAIAVLGLYLGIEGWRHASIQFQTFRATDTSIELRVPDWRHKGEDWAARTRAAAWYLEPDLTLSGLARLLGTNTTYLSRALNDGLGVNFSTFVNGLRAESVARHLQEGDRRDLLELALEAGFSSKASFNRAFRAQFNVPASEYRRTVCSQSAISFAVAVGDTSALAAR